MKYAFYPGCVARGAAPELYKSTMMVVDKLGIELEEIENMNRSNEMGVIRFEIGKILQKYKTELIDCIGKLSFRLCTCWYVYIFI